MNFTYLHDDSGNIIKRVSKSTGEITNYTFNEINQLLKIETLDSNNNVLKTVEYSYGPLRRRIAKIVNGNLFEHYVYSGDNVIMAFGNNGQRRYIHSDRVDEALVMVKDGNDYYMHGDNLGSVVTLSKEDKSIEEQYAYSAFGEMKIFDGQGVERVNTNLGNIYGFTGREMDEESDLYYYRARYYNPATGRFLSEDPIGFSSQDFNLYRYVGNEPLTFKDPSGLMNNGFFFQSVINASCANGEPQQVVDAAQLAATVGAATVGGAIVVTGGAALAGGAVSACLSNPYICAQVGIEVIDAVDSFSGAVGGPTTGAPNSSTGLGSVIGTIAGENLK